TIFSSVFLCIITPARSHSFSISYPRDGHNKNSNLSRISVLNSVFGERIRIQPNLGFADNKPYRTLDLQIRTHTNSNPQESNLTESSWSRDRILGSDSDSVHP
ncbi:unnamed protein product, partial [Adineta ricciae]